MKRRLNMGKPLNPPIPTEGAPVTATPPAVVPTPAPAPLSESQKEFQNLVIALPLVRAAVEAANGEVPAAGRDKVKQFAKSIAATGKVDAALAGRVFGETKAARTAAETKTENLTGITTRLQALIQSLENESCQDALRVYEKMLAELVANQPRQKELEDAIKRLRRICAEKDKEAAKEAHRNDAALAGKFKDQRKQKSDN